MVICADSRHRTASELHIKAAGLPVQAARDCALSKRKEVVSSVKGVENILSINPCV